MIKQEIKGKNKEGKTYELVRCSLGEDRNILLLSSELTMKTLWNYVTNLSANGLNGLIATVSNIDDAIVEVANKRPQVVLLDQFKVDERSLVLFEKLGVKKIAYTTNE
jgi:adenylate cyclase